MQKSKYNVVIRGNDASLLVNTFSKSIVKLDKKHMESFDKDLSLFTSEEVKALKDMNFLVNAKDESDEIEKLLIENKKEALNLILLPTMRCNFKCIYCYEKKTSCVTFNNKDYDEIIRFFELKKYKKINISWFGGEPTLVINDVINFTKRIKDFCTENKIFFSSGMTTNFYLLTEDFFAKAVHAGVTNYQVTIDGLRDVHNHYRPLCDGSGTYEQIMKNLVSAKSSSLDFKILLRINFDNKTNYDGIIEELGKNFSNDNRFELIFHPISNFGNIQQADYLCDQIESKNKYFELLRKAIDCGLNNSYNDFFTINFQCYANNENSFVISNEKVIKKCTVYLDNEENNVGSLGKEIHSDKNTKWEELRYENCKECPFFPLCLGKECKYNGMTFSECVNDKKERYEFVAKNKFKIV